MHTGIGLGPWMILGHVKMYQKINAKTEVKEAMQRFVSKNAARKTSKKTRKVALAVA